MSTNAIQEKQKIVIQDHSLDESTFWNTVLHLCFWNRR